MLNDAQRFWDAIVGKVRRTAQDESKNALRLERYEVTTAANGTKMGVTLPMGSKEIFLPYSQEVASATVGTPVLVAWWGSMSNAKVYFFADGYNSPTPAAIGAVSTTDVQYKIYNSVTDLGLTSGSATIAGAYAAMPTYSILLCQQGDFATSELPLSGAWYGQIEIIKMTSGGGSFFAHGVTTYGDFRMYLGSGNVPSGTWVNETNSGSFVIQRVNQNDGAAVSIPGYLSSNFSVAKAGYKPIGIAGFSAGNSYVYFSNVHLDGNYFYYEARVSNGGTVNAYPYAIVLYLKT